MYNLDLEDLNNSMLMMVICYVCNRLEYKQMNIAGVSLAHRYTLHVLIDILIYLNIVAQS